LQYSVTLLEGESPDQKAKRTNIAKFHWIPELEQVQLTKRWDNPRTDLAGLKTSQSCGPKTHVFDQWTGLKRFLTVRT
jgi:hypothetical protein